MTISNTLLLILIPLCILTCIYDDLNKHYKIELTYYDNSIELLNYEELPHIISTDSNTFCVIDYNSKICGVKSLKILK